MKSPCSASKAILSNCLNRGEQRFSATFSCPALIRSSPSLDVTFGAAEMLVQALEKPIARAFSGIDLRAQISTCFAKFDLSCTFFHLFSGFDLFTCCDKLLASAFHMCSRMISQSTLPISRERIFSQDLEKLAKIVPMY